MTQNVQSEFAEIQSTVDREAEAVDQPNEKRPCTTVLIPDDPSDSDAFGAHQTLAEAIAELIRTEDKAHEQPTRTSGRAIGIEGSWGSGKTTVIELLNKIIGDKEKCAVFVFDAWAHEGDPLRRTFLESLIDHFIGLGWFFESDWAKEKKIIQRQLEMKSTTTIPHFTALGIIVLLSLPLVPIGNAIVGAELRDGKITIDPSLHVSLRFLFGLALLTLPALIILGSWTALKLADAFRWIRSKSNKATSKSEVGGRSESNLIERTIWAMLLNKATTEKRFETNDTPVPTSIEFENTFNRIMTRALAGNDRKVVLVLDNLDRIAPAAALSIWSTLQTFLRPRQIPGREIAWLSRLWVIMPYDSGGLSQLWTRGSGSDGKPRQPAGPIERTTASDVKPAIGRATETKQVVAETNAKSSQAEDSARAGSQPDEIEKSIDAQTSIEAKQIRQPAIEEDSPREVFPAESRVALSFLDKSFQVRFEVPPPILSDWNNYLKRYLETAFPDHKKSAADKQSSERRNEFHACYRLYYWYLDKTTEHATPRGLKLYVNQIGVLHRQRRDEFPLHHLAYFVLLRRLGCDVVKEVLQRRLPHSDVFNLLGPDASSNLAAIAFNTTVEKARQIILDGPISGAITIRKPERFLDESKHEGFWEALERVSEDQIEKAQIVMFANLAYCLNKSGLLETDRGEADRIRLALGRGLDTHRRIWPFDNEVAEGLAELCKILRDVETVLFILQGIGEGLVSAVRVKEESIDTASWVTALRIMLSELRWLGYAVDDSQPRVGLRLLTEEERVELGNTEGGKPLDVPGHLVHGPELDQLLELVCERIAARFEIEKPIAAYELTRLVEAMSELQFAIPVPSVSLQNLSSKGYLQRHLETALAAKDADASAWCLYADLVGGQISLSRLAVDNSDAKENVRSRVLSGGYSDSELAPIARKFGSLLARFNSVNLPFEVAAADERFTSFAVTSFDEMSLKATRPVITIDLILQRWSFFNAGFPDRLGELVGKAGDQSVWMDRLTSTEFQRDHAPLYNAVADLRGALMNVEFQKWIGAGLSQMSREDWQQELRAPGSLISILQKLEAIDVDLQLGSEFADPLVEHARILAQQGYVLTILFQESLADWGKMASHISGEVGGAPSALSRIYEMISTTKHRIEGTFFECWGGPLATQVLQRDRSSVFESVFEPLARAQNRKGLQWVLDIWKSYPALFDGYENDPAINSFREQVRIGLYVQPASADVIPILEQLGAMMKLEREATPIRSAIAPLTDAGIVFISSDNQPHPITDPENNDFALATINLTIKTRDGFRRLLNVAYDEFDSPMTYHFATPNDVSSASPEPNPPTPLSNR